MFDLFRKENLTQEARLLKYLMRHEGKEVTLSSIVIGLKIFRVSEIVRRLRKKGHTIENRLDRTTDNFGNHRSYYKLRKK